MGIWDGIQDAEVFKKGNYLEPGLYLVEVERCVYKDTQRSGSAFIVELKVVESNNEKHPPSSTASWFQSMKDPVRKRMAFSSIKEFVLAIYGMDPNAKENQGKLDKHLPLIMEKACGEENFLGGKQVRLETFHTETKEKHNTFTVHRWSPVDGAGG